MTTVMEILWPNGKHLMKLVNLADEPSYDELRQAVGPFLGPDVRLGRVRVKRDGQLTDMLIDASRSGDFNAAASFLYPSPIYGIAILFSRPIWF
jgi:hypothetical protein